MDPFPKRTVSVLLNSDTLRDLRVFLLFDNNYDCVRYIDIITKRPQEDAQVIKAAKGLFSSREGKSTPDRNPQMRNIKFKTMPSSEEVEVDKGDISIFQQQN